nr:hypothetical protein [Tanacetum cinerariifolium]
AIVDIDLLLGEHLDTLSTGDRKIDFNPSMDIEELECLLPDDLVPVPWVFDEPLEMCMCLKDQLDTQKRKQDKSTLETLVDFEKEILDAEVQENEVIPLSDEEIALDAASNEGSMSGPGSGGEEAADYGYDVYHDDY